MPEEIISVIEKAVAAALHDCAVAYETEISCIITNNEQMQALNLAHRGVDKPTDVLSFPMVTCSAPGVPSPDKEDFDGDVLMLGDMVLSYQKAEEQAQEYGHSIMREVAFLCVHSVLHLLGHDHMDAQEEAAMLLKQEQILSAMGLRRE